MSVVGRVLTRIALCALCAWLAACANRVAAPVDERSPDLSPASGSMRKASGQLPQHHEVVKGDTLYAIAWHYGLDYRQLAGWNRIAPPYTIYPRQRLRLTAPARQPEVASSTPAKAVPKKTKPAKTQPVKAAPPASKPRVPASSPTRSITWRWPTKGAVYRGFANGQASRKGLDIAGQAGQAIVAAAPGTVVYSGVGLIGYGELIIIKHNQQFLSAYGHNRKRMVAQGDQVRAGQQIAEMGQDGNERPLLHFEIRRDGQPVDPQRYLPPRS